MSLKFDLLLTDFENITEVNIYRALNGSIDTANLGTPFQTLPKGSTQIVDDTISFGDTAQYLAESVFNDGTKKMSGVVEATYGETIICVTDNDVLHMVNFNGNKFDGFAINASSSFYVDVDGSGNFYVGDSSDRLTKYDSTGTEVWQNTAPVGDVRAICYDNVNDRVAVVTASRHLYMINNSDGTTLWTYTDLHSSTIYEVFVDNLGNVVTCSNDQTVKCVGGTTGELLWEYQELDNTRVNHVVCDTDAIFYVATATGKVRKLNFHGTLGDGNPYSFDESWSVDLGAEAECVNIHHANPDYVYACTHNDTFKIDKATGDIVFQFTLDSPVNHLRVTEKEYYVFNGSGNRYLYMYDPSGSLRWTDNTFSADYVYDFVFVPGKQSTAYGMHVRT